MNAVRKYYWKIRITAGQSHPVLEHLAVRTFEMETVNPPPEDGQTFVLRLDDFDGARSSPSDRCVEVVVIRRRTMMEYRNGHTIDSVQWYVMLYANIVGKADLP